MADSSQLEFNFDDAPPAPDKGMDSWRATMNDTRQKLSRRTGLPIGQLVQISLVSGIAVNGKLLVQDEWLEQGGAHPERIVFEVDGVSFLMKEIASCVRIEEEP